MNNPRRGKVLSTTLPIYSLSGGVGRQAPSKRLPSESEELINALVTVERSVEKRPGLELIPFKGAPDQDPDPVFYNGNELPLPDGVDLEYFWHALSDSLRYLFVINREATGTSDKLYYVFFYNQSTGSFEDHTPDDQSDIPEEVREYITYNGFSDLKFVAKAQNLVFLNPDVFAGYTSKPFTITQDNIDTGDVSFDGVAADAEDDQGDKIFTAGQVIWCTLGLNGEFATTGTAPAPINYTEDVKGKEVDYLTAVPVDPLGIAPFWDEYSTYLQGTQIMYIAIGDVDARPNEAATGLYYAESADIDPGDYPKINHQHWSVIEDRTAERISVKDSKYPDPEYPQLGQAVSTFADLRLPPLDVDVYAGNNNAEDMLQALYGLDSLAEGDGPPYLNSSDGKVYYVETGYQGQNPGYYLMKSTQSPHALKVRTPDAYSVFDGKRMPVELEFTGVSNGKSTWAWSTIDWEVRTSGDLETNPGPSAFKDGKAAKISTISFFRNRLFMSSGDNIFSSQDNDLTNLWISDPGTIVVTDPIDVLASSNKYTPITSMVPFNEYMFVNTDADTQYELMGSENQITPFTAELQPMTFYSTAPLIDPVTLGNNIFFFDRERLYLYMGRGGSLSTAVELSSHCPKYLPSNYGSIAVAPAQDTIMAVDADSPSDIYLYTTRYRGNEIAQNAFYKFNIEDADIQSIRSWDNFLYMVNNRGGKRYIERVSLRYEDVDIPLLDRRQKIKLSIGDTLNNVNPEFDPTGINCTFNADDFTTTFRVPFFDPDVDTIVLSDGFQTLQGAIPTIKTATDGTTYADYTIQGNFTVDENNDPLTGDLYIYIGRKFTMALELSPQFLRDQSNNPREGVLNLASMSTRHFQTGNYDVFVSRRGRPVEDVLEEYSNRLNSQLSTNYITSFAAPRVDTFEDSTLTLPNIEYQGELVSKILGFSDKTDIYILSDYISPVNITNIEIKGKFKATYSSIL